MRQAAAQQHNDDDDARDPPHHEPETLAPVAPGRDLGHVRTRRQAAFTPTINVLYQPQREPSAAPPSRDPWRTELSREIEVEGGASPGRADFSDVEQGRESGRSLFILSLPPTLARPSLPHCALPWTNGLSSVCRCNLIQSCWSLVDRTSQHDQVRSRTLDGVSNAAPRSRDAPDSPRVNVVCLSPRPPSQWQFPQGGVEAGETFQDEALREAEEEFGIPRTDVRGVLSRACARAV